MKLVTFNIRYDCGYDGDNCFDARKAGILKKIQVEDPDIISFQEVLPHVAQWLKANLPGYYVAGCPRGATLRDEQCCVAYRYDKFNLMKMDSYWLSPTPNVPGSRYPGQGSCPRICTDLVLQELHSGQVFRLLNTHLDDKGPEGRLQQIRQLMEALKPIAFFPDVPVFLAGDLNAQPEDEEIRLLSQFPGLHNLTPNIGITFHDFGRSSGCSIDYIFAVGNVACSSVEKWTDCEQGIWLSDHYPVAVTVDFM